MSFFQKRSPFFNPLKTVAAGGGGDQNVSLPTIATTVLLAPILAYAITTAALGPTATLNAPTVAYVVQPPAIASTVLRAPTVAYEVNLPAISGTVLSAPSLAYEV